MHWAKIQLFAKSWAAPPFSYHWLACLSISNNLQYLGHTHLTARCWLILRLGRLIRQPFTQCPLLLIAQYIWLGMTNAMVYIWLQSPCQCQQLKCVNITHCLLERCWHYVPGSLMLCNMREGSRGEPMRTNEKQMRILTTFCLISERNEKLDTYEL